MRTSPPGIAGEPTRGTTSGKRGRQLRKCLWVFLGQVERKLKQQKLRTYLPNFVKDNKLFYEYINGNRRAKENLHSLMDPEGNTVTKSEEKAEVLNTLPGGVKEKLDMTVPRWCWVRGWTQGPQSD